MNRRTFMGTGLAAFASANLLSQQARAVDEETIYVSVGNGADSNPGTRQSPLKTLSAAATKTGCWNLSPEGKQGR